MEKAGDFEGMPKREALSHTRELEKLSRNLGGIANLERLPNAIFVIDTKKEHIAVTEARKLGLPVVAVVDTNCDPDIIDYVIPGNDDAIRSGSLMCRVLADAVVEGRFIAEHRRKKAPPPAEEVAPALAPARASRPAAAAAGRHSRGAAAEAAPSERAGRGRACARRRCTPPRRRRRAAAPEAELAEVNRCNGGLSMATITAKDVQRLRQATGAGMLDGKKALEEADGDFDAAPQIPAGQGPGRRGEARRPRGLRGRRGRCAHRRRRRRGRAALRDRLRGQGRRVRGPDRRAGRPGGGQG